MTDVITVTVDNLPAITGVTGDEQIAVYKGGKLGRMPQSALRGTRTFSDASNPPTQPTVIALMAPLLGDRWRNTSSGDEWKVTSLVPFVWAFDGNVRGPAGETLSVPVPGPPGTTTAAGLTDVNADLKAVLRAGNLPTARLALGLGDSATMSLTDIITAVRNALNGKDY